VYQTKLYPAVKKEFTERSSEIFATKAPDEMYEKRTEMKSF